MAARCLLDEIGDVPSAMQVKLLRVLQEREVVRVGETRPRRVDIRVIAATNRDLGAEVAARRFRADLYYRLRVIDLPIPPLRQRPDDLDALLRELLPKTAQRLGRPIAGYTARALAALYRYPWPGNIRELEHALERACAVASGPEIDLDDLPEEVHASGPSGRRPPASVPDPRGGVHPRGPRAPRRRPRPGRGGARDLALDAQAPPARRP